jgi:hypothetical protein
MARVDLLLQHSKVVAIVPPPLVQTDETALEPLEVIPVLTWWVRGTLVGIAASLLVVFSIALWLNPYDEQGSPRQMETHRQLGLPPCTFYQMTHVPCPSCGMTTSFALLIRGDVWNSLKANAVGTVLAAFCLLLIPWSLASSFLKRPVFILSIERALTKIVVVFLVVMLLRWAIVLTTLWMSRADS